MDGAHGIVLPRWMAHTMLRARTGSSPVTSVSLGYLSGHGARATQLVNKMDIENSPIIRRPQLAAGGARQRTPSKRKTTGNLFSARAAALASLLLAFFLDHSESDVRPSDRAAARSPSLPRCSFFYLIFGRYPVKHNRLHQEPTCRKPSKHIFKQHAIWDANVSDCPHRLRVYKHVTFCLVMSLRYPTRTRSLIVSHYSWSNLTSGFGGRGRQPFIRL